MLCERWKEREFSLEYRASLIGVLTINPHLEESHRHDRLDHFVRPQFRPKEMTQPEEQLVNPELYNKLDALAALLGGSKTGGAA